MNDHKDSQRGVRVLFLFYLAALIYLVFFAEAFRRGDAHGGTYAYNLELFKEIRRFYLNRESLGMRVVMVNLAGNILAFVPFGFMAPMTGRRSRGFFRIAFLSFLLSLCIECIQLVSRVGSFDVDDIFLNTVGGIVGYLLYWIVLGAHGRWRAFGDEKES